MNSVHQFVPVMVMGWREEAARSWMESMAGPWTRTVSSAARLAV